jgi:uncharacterized protein YraI
MRQGFRIVCAAAALAWAGWHAPVADAASTRVPALTSSAGCRYWVAGDEPVRVYSGPGESYPPQGWISGTSADVLVGSCSGDWVQLSQGGFTGGWIQRALLQPVVAPDPS